MAERFEFKAEIQQLLNILIYSLYTEQEIFLRELLSNASDALHRLQFEMLTAPEVFQPDAPLEITLSVDEEVGTITLRDTGIGMTRDELVTNLGTIAQSGAAAFLKALQEKGDSATNIIGQFGVGFYSVFMVADRVQVTSRSYLPEAAPARWISDGSETFEVEDVDAAAMPQRGTEIVITLKEDAKSFADEWRLRQIIKRHSDFVAFPIYVGEPEDGEPRTPANQQTALWRQSPRGVEDDAYRSFYRQVTLDFQDPLAWMHLSSEAPLDLHAILYVPSARDRGMLAPKDHGLRLYSRSILIQERTPDLLPDYLRFVEGVVDSEDLPLNVSRESVQSNTFVRKIRSNLVRRILRELKELAEKDTDRFQTFWDQFGMFVKEGVATTLEDHEHLLPLLRFHSSQTGGAAWVSLAEYAARMPEGQEKIYYLFGEDLKSITSSPHLDPFKASGAEVLYLTEPIDSFMMMALHEYEGHAFQNIADADADVPETEETPPQGDEVAADLFNPLLQRFNEVLSERVSAVREAKRLSHSPARLVVADDAPGAGNLDRVRRYVDEDYQVSRRALEINRRHPLIRGMAQRLHADALDPVVPELITQLYENALLIEGIHPNPAEMVDRIQAIMNAAAGVTARGGAVMPAPDSAVAETAPADDAGSEADVAGAEAESADTE